MKQKSTVSIIVPVYNAEIRIKKCIESILKQTYKNIEIILVNDGSNDHSGEICDNFAMNDERIKVLHQKNRGPSVARNKGLQVATGEYVQFVDSDDYIDSAMTEKLIKEIKKETQLVLCGYKVIKNEKIVYNNIPNVSGVYEKTIFLEFFGELYDNLFINSPCNKLFNNRIIKKNNINFPEEINMGEDLLFNIEYLRACDGEISVSQDDSYNYIKHDDYSLTKIYNKSYFENQKMLYETVKKFLIEANQYKGKNERLVELNFSQVIVSSISKLFQSKSIISNDDIKRQIKKIISNDSVYENAEFMKREDIKLKIVGFLIRNRDTKPIFYVFNIKSIFEK